MSQLIVYKPQEETDDITRFQNLIQAEQEQISILQELIQEAIATVKISPAITTQKLYDIKQQLEKVTHISYSMEFELALLNALEKGKNT